jgi:hydrogenase maturation protein HypF
LRRVTARVEGVVQGVGFRPYVFRLATGHRLSGSVRNDSSGVLVDVEGPPGEIEAFLRELPVHAPPLARIDQLSVAEAPPAGERRFTIAASDAAGEPRALVAADSATCADCLAELFDPADRRYRYPFINCTNCGPRFTIVRGVPYDRPATTMAGFTMCPACQAEYDDPADRRFHAQPNACPACGPQTHLWGQSPEWRATQLLREGAIVAVKGLGGYHLACLASDADAVSRLRARKHREDRPFALMAADIAAARELVVLDTGAEALLTAPARPIVLAPARSGARVAAQVAPRSRDLGVMLAYSPLHHLLLADVGEPLVMTSGNVSDEPIAYTDDDALERLAGIADAFLLHDRPIHIRTDDSVVTTARGRPLVLRRSRGHVPESLTLPVRCARPLLACGAELKSTFCVAKGDRAWLGHHIGDLRNAETLASFQQGIAHFERLFAVTPRVVAHDLHPDYLSTAYALAREDVELVPVQHHHAHLAACLAEHGETGPAVGAIYDGTGHGSDGTAWGGEILAGDLRGFERIAWLRPVRLPGGDRAVREPWRMACAWLAQPDVPPLLRDAVGADAWEKVAALVRTGLASPVTTSMGRLFDAVAALCGVRAYATYEGQAAIELEALADRAERGAYELDGLDPRPLLHAIQADLAAGVAPATVSARFHRAIAAATACACAQAASDCATELVVLSGGVFQNRLLLEDTAARLERLGLRVLSHERVPPNDGGIAFGQAAIAAAVTG